MKQYESTLSMFVDKMKQGKRDTSKRDTRDDNICKQDDEYVIITSSQFSKTSNLLITICHRNIHN